jgi:hypothetical protein
VIGELAFLLLAAAQPGAAESCTWENAVRADVRAMAVAPQPWIGRCVRLEGLVTSNVYFADVAGAYAASATNERDRANDGWLGLYLPRNRDYSRRPVRAELIGTIDTCEASHARRSAQAGPDGLVMMFGYCHYRGGLILRGSGFRPGSPARFVRQMGDANRRAFGDLETEAEAGPAPREVRELGERFLRGLRTRDAAALLDFVGLWSEYEHPERPRWRARFGAWLTGDRGSPLAALRDGPERPQTAFFREMIHRDEREDGETGDWHICYCKTADCSATWPISADDATAEPVRPYVCLRAFDEDHGNSAPDRLAVVRRGRLREPPETAFRR